MSASLSKDDLIQMYKDMLFYRRFEERTNAAYTKRKFSGFCHLHIGQEAACVGIQKNLRVSDAMISGYRSHTQSIAKGIPAEQVFGELFGKKTGCSRGKGGSMHMFSNKVNFLGGHGIVGGQVPLAVGAAFAQKYNKTDDITVCYIGDGAMNQGQVYESFNMAATWKLPCLFVIENNQYGMGTSYKRVTAVEDLKVRSDGFGFDSKQIDGMNVETVYKHSKSIIDKMRKDSMPFLLELMTYRYKGHSVSDPATYRTKDEVKTFQDQDPIQQLGKTLQAKHKISEEQLESWDDEARAAVKAAEAKADEAPLPDEDSIWQDVYV